MQEKSHASPPISLAALRAAWTHAHGATPPEGLGRTLLSRGLAWKKQEQAGGGISTKIENELRGLSGQLVRLGEIRVDQRGGLNAGTRLVTEWGGETHTVQVLEGGFMYRDKNYPSLSTLAQVITGVKWSGPRFFGLRQSSKASGEHSNA